MSNKDDLAKERTRQRIDVQRLKDLGLNNKTIAERLDISPNTVGRRLKEVKDKLNQKQEGDSGV